MQLATATGRSVDLGGGGSPLILERDDGPRPCLLHGGVLHLDDPTRSRMPVAERTQEPTRRLESSRARMDAETGEQAAGAFRAGRRTVAEETGEGRWRQ